MKLSRVFSVATVVFLCLWVLAPIYLLLVNTFSSPADVSAFPKKLVPPMDTESVQFFMNYHGVGKALWSSLKVAAITMINWCWRTSRLCTVTFRFPW